MVGILERYGLREKAEMLIGKMKVATVGKILMMYFVFRQISAALGIPIGGHPTFVRPLISPMAEAAASKKKQLSPQVLEKIRAMAATSENYGNFYGQLIFVASGGLLLIKGVMTQAGYNVSLLDMAKYALSTGLIAFLVIIIRYMIFDKQLEREIAQLPDKEMKS